MSKTKAKKFKSVVRTLSTTMWDALVGMHTLEGSWCTLLAGTHRALEKRGLLDRSARKSTKHTIGGHGISNQTRELVEAYLAGKKAGHEGKLHTYVVEWHSKTTFVYAGDFHRTTVLAADEDEAWEFIEAKYGDRIDHNQGTSTEKLSSKPGITFEV